jgi:DNA segregation ATPase FtsK/SpoIIIE-like protein
MSNSTQPTEDSGAELVVAMVSGLLAALWRFRVELVLLGLPALAYLRLAALIGKGPAALVVGLIVVVALIVPATRRRVVALFVRAHWRRRMERALRQLAPTCFGDVPPLVGRITKSRFGVHVAVRLRQGHAPAHLEQAAEHLAAALRVAHVRVERERTDGSVVYLTLVLADPFAAGPLHSPWSDVETTSLWAPVPIGLDESGRLVTLALAERNLLAGGEPGSAKSNLLQQIAAVTALDPTAQLYCLDPKVVELWRWAPVAAGFAGANLDEALAMLRRLDVEMAERYQFLQERHQRKITATDGVGLKVLLIDELMIYLTDTDKKASAEFASLLRKLVALGRAAGIVVVVATQKPSVDVLPSSIRDNIAYRAAFRCSTREASDTILGTGWASNGYSASDIDAATPGVCWLLADGSSPQRLRCFYLSDNELDALVERACVLRQ